MANLQTSAGTSISVGASVNLLGFDMNAMLAVTNGTNGANIQALVLPGITDSYQEVSLAEMLESISTTLGTPIETGGLESALNYVGLNVNDTYVRMNQAFALYDNTDPAKKTMEYAFSVSIVNKISDSAPKGIFTIRSLSFAIWNSTRPSVIGKMALGSIEDMLERMDKAALISTGTRPLLEG